MRYYGDTDFLSEKLNLQRTPQNATEAYNKLVCLMQFEQLRDADANCFYVKPLSKRRQRLVRMFDAYKRMRTW